MKKIVVISDTHGNLRAIDDIMQILAESDYIFHLGDTSYDGMYVKKLFPSKTYVLNGNCDFPPLCDNEKVVEIEGVKIFACHGHRYSVKSTLEKLALRAEARGCQIALYGHTHIPGEQTIRNVRLINPGTMSRYAQPSYCYLVINDKKAVSTIVYPARRT